MTRKTGSNAAMAAPRATSPRPTVREVGISSSPPFAGRDHPALAANVGSKRSCVHDIVSRHSMLRRHRIRFMELRQLEYFVEVARKGTYLAASASLSVAQPALWRQVKELERELGVPLFERVGRRVRLTRNGEALADQAATVLAASGR